MENVNEEIKRIEELLKKPLPAGLKSNMEDRLALLKKKASGEEPATKKKRHRLEFVREDIKHSAKRGKDYPVTIWKDKTGKEFITGEKQGTKVVETENLVLSGFSPLTDSERKQLKSSKKAPVKEKVSDFDIIKRTYYWEAVTKNGESTGIEGKTKAETLKKLKENLSETEKKPSPKKQKPKPKAITLEPNFTLKVDQVKTEDGKTLYGGGLNVLGEITVKFFPFMYKTDKELIARAKKYLTEIVSVSLIRDRGEKTKDGRYLVFFNDGQEHKQYFSENRMALNFRNALLPIVKKNQNPKAPAKKRSELPSRS
jgi:hypothetical protein